MQKQPFLILCICFILGIFLQDYFQLSFTIICISVVFSFLTLFVFVVNQFYFHRFRAVSLGVLFFSLGVFVHDLQSENPQFPKFKNKENIVFKITKKLNSNPNNRRYEIIAWKENVEFKSILSIPKVEKELNFQHYYKGEAYINKIEKPYSDFQFDYGKYLSRKDIYFQSYLQDLEGFKYRKHLSFSEKIKQKRLETLQKIDSTSLQKSTREFTKGIILADRTEMDKNTVQDFTKSGLVHILAISGSHMAIIFWLILIVLKPVFPTKFRKYKIIIALVLIWSFAVFIDYGSSVVRSCIMVTAYYTYVLLQRKTDLLHSMAVAAFVILATDTNQVFDVGFQLSFLAVFGIFWLNQPILKHLPKPKNKFQNFLLNVISISISAQIATFPLVIYYFHQYSFISIVANLVVIPFSEILIIFSLLMTILIAFSMHCSWLNIVYDFCVETTLKVIHFFAEIDFVFYKMIPMTLLEVFVAFIAIYYLRFLIVKFNFKNTIKVIYFLLLFIMLRFSLNYQSNQMSEIVVHRYFKNVIVSDKIRDKVRFLMHDDLDFEKVKTYVIEPYLTSRRAANFEIVKIPASVEYIKIRNKTFQLNN